MLLFNCLEPSDVSKACSAINQQISCSSFQILLSFLLVTAKWHRIKTAHVLGPCTLPTQNSQPKRRFPPTIHYRVSVCWPRAGCRHGICFRTPMAAWGQWSARLAENCAAEYSLRVKRRAGHSRIFDLFPPRTCAVMLPCRSPLMAAPL